MSISYDLGKEGEQHAVLFLTKKGYTIKRRNYRYLKAEIDIIAQIGNELVFVEVKTRSSEFFGDPSDSVNRKKEKLIALAADHYVQYYNLDVEVRYDFISIIINNGHVTIDHIEDAFYPFQNL
jgi:putative endonuclease